MKAAAYTTKFSAARYIHDVEIAGVDHVPTEICHNGKCHRYDSRCAGTKSVKTIGEIRAVADCSHHYDDHKHKHYPAQGLRRILITDPASEPFIVEVIVLDKGDSGLRSLYRMGYTTLSVVV